MAREIDIRRSVAIAGSAQRRAAARHILDSAGLQNVQIDQIHGQLSDNYDSRDKVLHLSPEVYQGRTLAAVGIAAHESGHALQDAQAYAPLVVRNAAVPAANFGSGIGMWIFVIGFAMHLTALAWIGVALFSCIVIFQVVNLATCRIQCRAREPKHKLVQLGIINQEELYYVNKVLTAAGWTYVAGTLESIMTLLYFVSRLNGRRD